MSPAPQAIAQPTWPTKPLRTIVPFAPGSFTDVSARAIAAEIRTWKNVIAEAGVKLQ